MNTFYIITNEQKDPTLEKTLRLKQFLESKGKSCRLREESGEMPGPVDCILVLGGDGTLLRASRQMVHTGVPLMGINIGTLGYLAEIEYANAQEALERVCAGNFSIERRMMLKGAVYRGGRQLMKDIALNDIVIGRCGHLRVMEFRVFVNQTFLCDYRADGMILSTATGSTGYSLSAGGPIVSPDARLILMTPIAPHTLNSRPVILPSDVTVHLRISEKNGALEGIRGEAEVTFDGDSAMTLRPGDEIRITKASQETSLVKVYHTSFVETLRRKMN